MIRGQRTEDRGQRSEGRGLTDCSVGEIAAGESFEIVSAFSLTPRFSGVYERIGCENRFSGFRRGTKTAEAVRDPQPTPFTPLKRDVNERVALIKVKSKSSRVSINLG